MICYQCSGKTQIFNSRSLRRTNQTWRRHRCILCDAVFSTVESIDYSKSLVVGDHDQTGRQPFSRDRLMISLYKSLSHRRDAINDAGALSTTIISKLALRTNTDLVSPQHIVDVSIIALGRFDKLAAQHYQAVHKR